MSAWTVLKDLEKKKLPDKECFYSSVKDRTTVDNGKKLDGHKIDKDHLMCKKFLKKFNMKNRGDYHDYYFCYELMFLESLLTRA